MLTTDPYEIVESPEITVVAELIGGVHPAYELIKKAIEKKNGKPAVPAKKPVHKANRSARLVKKVEAKKAA